jgi:hypothetical protein
MAEDSGAFKTNPPNSGWISAFYGGPGQRCTEASPLKETFSGTRPGGHAADF